MLLCPVGAKLPLAFFLHVLTINQPPLFYCTHFLDEETEALQAPGNASWEVAGGSLSPGLPDPSTHALLPARTTSEGSEGS